MDQPLLPGIEEADLINNLGFLHDWTVWSLQKYDKAVSLTPAQHKAYTAWLTKNVKKAVDNKE